MLAEVRKLTDGREQFELVLTMTDLSLEQARDQAVEAQIQQKQMSVPIPLPDRQRASAQTARPPEANEAGASS